MKKTLYVFRKNNSDFFVTDNETVLWVKINYLEDHGEEFGVFKFKNADVEHDKNGNITSYCYCGVSERYW